MKNDYHHARQRSFVESLILQKFMTEPFHNFYFMGGLSNDSLEFGGTCSEKTLSLKKVLDRSGIQANLHTAFIKKKEIHRLIKVTIDEGEFFADIGNGWPSVKLYPVDQDIEYHCFGMCFRTELKDDRLSVYCLRKGLERHQMDIPLKSKSETEILADIKSRFESNIDYPFESGIRFAMVVGKKFLFLRDDRLEIYSSDEPYQEITGIRKEEWAGIISTHFQYDIGVFSK